MLRNLHENGYNHYINTPGQFISIFTAVKIPFLMKIINIVLVPAQNIYRGYLLESAH